MLSRALCVVFRSIAAKWIKADLRPIINSIESRASSNVCFDERNHRFWMLHSDNKNDLRLWLVIPCLDLQLVLLLVSFKEYHCTLPKEALRFVLLDFPLWTLDGSGEIPLSLTELNPKKSKFGISHRLRMTKFPPLSSK